MNATKRTNYSVIAVTCAVLYALIVAVGVSVLIYQNPLETLRPEYASIEMQDHPDALMRTYWHQGTFILLGMFSPVLAGGLLAPTRPRVAGWIYLAAGLGSIGLAAWLYSLTGAPELAGAMIIVPAYLTVALITFPMLTIAALLLTKTRSTSTLVALAC